MQGFGQGQMFMPGQGQGQLLQIPGQGAGSGGVDRGGGSAPLGQRDAEAFDVGDAEILPQAVKVNPDGSVTLREVQRDPDLDAEALEAASRAQLKAWDASSADARRVRVSPQHRAAVESYFAADQESGQGGE